MLYLLALRQQRCAYAHHQYADYDAERSHSVNLHPLMYEHLRTDEEQQHAHTRLQITEAVGYGSQKEEHGTQPEYGEDVGEEHHVGVERHGEYGRACSTGASSEP